MVSEHNSNAKHPVSSKLIPHTTHITLVHQDQPATAALYQTLATHGFQTRWIALDTNFNYIVAQTDLVIIDLTTTQEPKASQLVRAARILVLTDGDDFELPPWFQAGHIVLQRYPKTTADLIDLLARQLLPATVDFDPETGSAEDLALLFKITQRLKEHQGFNDLCARILALAPFFDAEFAALLLRENDNIIYYRSNQPGRELLSELAGQRLARRLLQQGLEGWVIEHNQTVMIPNTHEDARWLRPPYLPEEMCAVTVLPVILTDQNVTGAYLLGHRQPDHFSHQQIPLLEAALSQITLILENALLVKNQTQQAAQLALINEVSQAATSILNLDMMLQTVVTAISRSFSFYRTAIYLYDRGLEGVQLQAQAFADNRPDSPQSEREIFRLYEGLVGRTAATHETVLANDVSRETFYIPLQSQQEIRAELCVPIAMSAKIIGVLDLHSTQLEAFDAYQVAAFETLADQLAIAIENARLYDKINQHVQELRSLNQIGQAITSSLDLNKTLTLITNQAIYLMDAEAASVALYDKKRDDVWFAAASGLGSEAVVGIRMARGKGIAGWVTENGEPVIVADVQTDQRFFGGIDQQSGFTTRSILCVPLQTKGHYIGALEVMNKRNGTFNQDDLALLQALAAPAATALENAQLYEEKTRTIERLAETQNQLIQSAKLAAVGELAAGVAHEINNPLTTIIGLTCLLLDTPLDEEIHRDLEMVNNEAMRARDIVRRLLDFARSDSPNRHLTDFNQLVEEAVLLVFTKSLSRQIELQKKLAPLPDIFLDANQIKQVIVNLLNNATQAILENPAVPPQLTIETRIETGGGQQSPPVSQNEPQRYLVCTIRDSGIGIKPEHLDKIFDPFFTTKEVGQGTGLGLSISYGIVEQHGGTITVESMPDQGSTFTVTLPIIDSGQLGYLNYEDDADEDLL